MKSIRCSKGITLVEVLAVIVIMALIITLSMQVLVSGMNYSEKQSNKAKLQQHYNYILTVWREYHESGKEYEVILNDKKSSIIFKETASSVSTVIQDNQFTYAVKVNDMSIDFPLVYKIDPKSKNSISIKITIMKAMNGNENFEGSTILSRL